MNPGEHLTDEQLAGLLVSRSESAAMRHLSACTDCHDKWTRLAGFAADLGDVWTAAALEQSGAAHPAISAIERLWMGEVDGDARAALEAHIGGCENCSRHLVRLKEGFETLMQSNPLQDRLAWAQVVPRRFAAAIEVAVEAARGSFTCAGSLIAEAMTPQARTRLAPAHSMAMGAGRPLEAAMDAPWHDASFQTDEVSGELTGSTDPITGRGIVRVVVNKAPAYAGRPPLVDVHRADGTLLSSQHAVDTGDRYVATFADLDEGRYLVGVREPKE